MIIASGAWWVNHVVPGVIVSVIWAAIVALSHARLWHRIRRHIDQVTSDQNTRIEQITRDQDVRIKALTAAQTAQLMSGSDTARALRIARRSLWYLFSASWHRSQ